MKTYPNKAQFYTEYKQAAYGVLREQFFTSCGQYDKFGAHRNVVSIRYTEIQTSSLVISIEVECH